MSRALGEAQARGDNQALASVWFGIGSVVLMVISFLASSGLLYVVALAGGVAAIVTGRFARQRGQATGDAGLVHLGRWGQVTGWIVVGLFVAVVLLFAAFLGSFAGGFATR